MQTKTKSRQPDEQTSGGNCVVKRGRLSLDRFDDFRQRLDADELAHAAAVAELDDTVDLREQGVILAPADILARLDLGAALANDDGAAGNDLTTEQLDAKPLRV